MYLQHFALTRYPFQTMDHPDELFKSKAGSETETRLLHLLELRGIGLLTGEVGCGKTTACRQVTAGLHPGLYRVYYVSLTTGSILDTYQVIAWELGLATERSRATAYRAIRTELSRLAKEAKQLPVLVIDEAQHLRNDVLEDLRLLTSFNMDAEHRLCLLLVGLSELRRRLSMAVHESLSQRIVMRHHLGGVVFQFVSVDFTKLFHELVRSLFELVHYCRRELRPGKGPVEPYVSVKLATVTLSCSSELIHKIPRPCIGII